MINTHSLRLTTDDFNYDLTEGFEMAIEKEWHLINPISVKDIVLYDSDLKELSPSKYGIRIFYKLVLPLCYFEGHTDLNNPLIVDFENEKYFDFKNAAAIGSPVAPLANASNVYAGKKGLVIAKNIYENNSNYALPVYRQLNHTYIKDTDFATGTSIGTLVTPYQLSVDSYFQPKDIMSLGDDYIRTSFVFMSKNDVNEGGVSAFDTSDGYVSYTVTTEANRMNLPEDSSRKYLMPLLFKPFGMGWKSSALIENEKVGWLYCVFGVEEVLNSDQETDADLSERPANAWKGL